MWTGPNASRDPKTTKLKTQNCQSSFCNRPPRESPPFCLLLSFSSGSKPEHCCTIAMVLHTVLLLTNLGSEPRIFGLYSVGCPIWETVAPPCLRLILSLLLMIMIMIMMAGKWVLIFNQRCVFTFKLPVTAVASHTDQNPFVYFVFVPSFYWTFGGVFVVVKFTMWIHKGWNLENSSSMNLVNRLNAL